MNIVTGAEAFDPRKKFYLEGRIIIFQAAAYAYKNCIQFNFHMKYKTHDMTILSNS